MGTGPVTVHNPDEREKEVAAVVVWGTATDADNLDTWKMNVTLMNRSPPYFISLPPSKPTVISHLKYQNLCFLSIDFN